MVSTQSKIQNVSIFKVQQQQIHAVDDCLAVEEPLEIKIEWGEVIQRQQKSISITMRTPGHDFELAIGFLFTEGIIRSLDEVTDVAYCPTACKKTNNQNVVLVCLAPTTKVDLNRLERHFYTSSSCGVCGKASIEALQMNNLPPLPNTQPIFSSSIVHQLPNFLEQTQQVFSHTGGLHAAALFAPSGKLHLVREDVGRHNAVDKLIGAAFQAQLLPLHDYAILVSGRASFELIQKSLMAGIPILAAVGAPSSLAVQLAEAHNMTVLGFVRQQRFNIYTGAWRIEVGD